VTPEQLFEIERISLRHALQREKRAVQTMCIALASLFKKEVLQDFNAEIDRVLAGLEAPLIDSGGFDSAGSDSIDDSAAGDSPHARGAKGAGARAGISGAGGAGGTGGARGNAVGGATGKAATGNAAAVLKELNKLIGAGLVRRG